MKKNTLGLSLIFAAAILFSAGGALHAESGLLFLEGKQSDRHFKMTATPISGTWRFMPGGFMVSLTGGHRFIYRKLPGNKAHFQLHRKIGSTVRVYTGTYNNTQGVSYGMHNGKRRFLLTRNRHVSKRGPDRNTYYQIYIKRGSVLFK